MKAKIKPGDVLEKINGGLVEVLQITFEYQGIYKIIIIDENGEKSITSSYFFKGFEVNN
jgi:hypothetical protein